MSHTRIIYFLAIIAIVMSSCRNSKNGGNQEEEWKASITEKLGTEVEYIPNEDKSLMLCVTESKLEGSPGKLVKFVVYDQTNKSIVHEDQVSNGTVGWHDKKRLSLFYVPGTMAEQQTRDDYTFIVDVYSKEKIKKTELE